MPVYNHAEYVTEAVESVLGQSYDNWELVITDDGSTDGSGEIVDDLARRDSRITVIHRSNAGPAVARNTAAERAQGQWLTYLDSDDIWFPSTLGNFADYIAKRPDIKFIYGYRHRLNDDGSVTELAGKYQDGPTGPVEIFRQMYISHLCVCYKRELLEEAGGYDESLRSVEDYDLYLRMSLHVRFWPLGLPTGLRRRHGSNISHQTGMLRLLEAKILHRFLERYGGRKFVSDDVIAKRLGKVYYSAGREFFKSACFAQAVEAIKKAHGYRRTFKGSLIRLISTCLKPLGRTDTRELPEI